MMRLLHLLLLGIVLCNTAQARTVSTPELIQAVQSERMSFIIQLIKGGTDVNVVNAIGRSAAHYAIARNNLSALQLLLDNGADPNLADHAGNTLLDIAQEHKNEEMLALLQAAGAKPSFIKVEEQQPIISPTIDTAPLPEDRADSRELWQATANNDRASAAQQPVRKWPFKFLKFSGRVNNLHFESKVEGQSLWQAAANNNRVAVEHLLNKGADARVRNLQDKVPFDVAADAEYAALAAILLKAAAGVNGLDERGWTPLMWAIVDDDWDLAREFIREGADIFAGRRQNALDVAKLMESEAKLLEVFIEEKGVDATVRRYGTDTMLILAAIAGNTETVKLLLERGADTEADTEYAFNSGCTALMIAASQGNTEIVKLLLEYGANIEAQNSIGLTALMIAARWGYTEIVKLLLDHSANIEAQNKGGLTALHRAAENGKTETAALLLETFITENGIDATAKQYGGIALIIAALSGQTETAALLLEHGANIDAQDKFLQTALIHALSRGKTEAVALLIENGANIEAQNKRGWTALMIAAEHGNTETVEALLKHGADTEAKSNRGWTPLMNAVHMGKTETVKLLLEYGANIEARSRYYQTASSLAEQSGHREIVQLLHEHSEKNISVQQE